MCGRAAAEVGYDAVDGVGDRSAVQEDIGSEVCSPSIALLDTDVCMI